MKTVEESMLSLLPNGKNVSSQYRLLLFGCLLRADKDESGGCAAGRDAEGFHMDYARGFAGGSGGHAHVEYITAMKQAISYIAISQGSICVGQGVDFRAGRDRSGKRPLRSLRTRKNGIDRVNLLRNMAASPIGVVRSCDRLYLHSPSPLSLEAHQPRSP